MHASVTTTVPHHAAENGCYLHGGGQRDGERYIDTGVHIEGEGFIAICEGCITYLGGMLGLITPDGYKGLSDELAEANDVRVTQAQRLVLLERHNEALRVLLAGHLDEIPELEEPVPAEIVDDAEPDPIEQGLAVLAEIRAEADAALEAPAPSRHVTPTWRESDGVDEALAREHAEVDTQ